MAAFCRKLKIRTSSRPKTWSAWAWVKRIASTRGRPKRSACARRSVGVSTRAILSPISSLSPTRQRLFLGLPDWQTAQVQPITGTPVEVPLPSMVTRKDMGLPSLPQPLHLAAAEPGVEQSRLAARDGKHPRLVEVPQEKDIVPFGQPARGIAADGVLRKLRAVLEVGPGEPPLGGAHGPAGEGPRDVGQGETDGRALRQAAPEAVFPVAVVQAVAVHGEVAAPSHGEGGLQHD